MNLVPAPRPRHSPCMGVCKIDAATGWCLGCGRTTSEIGSWTEMEEAERDGLWAALPERLGALSVRVRLLPLTGTEILDWVADSILHRRGTWVAGAPGAVAEFPCRPERSIDVSHEREAVIARAADAAFRLDTSDKLRAFVFADDGPTVLGFPKGRVPLATATQLTFLGHDARAIADEHRGDELFDMGIGRRYSRFCVRTGEAKLIETLHGLGAQHWSEVMSRAGQDIIASGPNRVVETALARIEVYAPIPPPGGRSPDGAHTHFLPQFLATGEEIPSALALPDWVAPVAIFYPGKPPA